jgi:hypothetical protein
MSPADAMRFITTFAEKPLTVAGWVSGGRMLDAVLVLPIPMVLVTLVGREFGHGFFARLARVPVTGIRIGGGTCIVRWRWGNVDLEICRALWKGAHIDVVGATLASSD